MTKKIDEEVLVDDTASYEAVQDEPEKALEESRMDKVLSESKNPPSVDDVIEGTVLAIEKAKVFIDIPPFGTGIIYGREYINARDIIKKINIGDTVAGKVISLDNKDGYIEISLKEARQALIWSEAEAAIAEKKIFELSIQEANKGGLMLSRHYRLFAGIPAQDRALSACNRWRQGQNFGRIEKTGWSENFRGYYRRIAKRRQIDILREKSRAEKQRVYNR